jgi:hypothetical protein
MPRSGSTTAGPSSTSPSTKPRPPQPAAGGSGLPAIHRRHRRPLRDTPADRRGGPDRQLPPVRQPTRKHMTTSTTTSAGTAIRAVFAQTSRAWADGDEQAFAAWYAPGATVILPGVYLPGQDAIREAMAAAFARPLKNTRLVRWPPRAVHPLHRPWYGHRDHRQGHRFAGRTSASGSAARTSDLGAGPAANWRNCVSRPSTG